MSRLSLAKVWSYAAKPCVIALFVVCGLAAAPKTASADQAYRCGLSVSGAFTYGPVSTNGNFPNDTAAIGWCQDQVNQLALFLCDVNGGDAGPFYIRYQVIRIFGQFGIVFVDETTTWNCIDGYPYGS